jgi:hypothetical protein
MGEIIRFAREMEGQRKRRYEERPGSARILFFTGVRYARQEAPVAGYDEGDSGAPRAGGIGGRRRKRRG